MSTTAGPSSITLLTTWTLCDVLARGVLKPSEVEYVTEEIVRRIHPPLDAVPANVREAIARMDESRKTIRDPGFAPYIHVLPADYDTLRTWLNGVPHE